MGAQYRCILWPSGIHHLRGLHVLPQHSTPVAAPPWAPLRVQGAHRRAAASLFSPRRGRGWWSQQPVPPPHTAAPASRGILLHAVSSPRCAPVGPGEWAHLRCSADGCSRGVGAICGPLGVWGHGCITGPPLRLSFHLPAWGGRTGIGGVHGGTSLCQQAGSEALLVPGLLLWETGLLCTGGCPSASAGRGNDIHSRICWQSRRRVNKVWPQQCRLFLHK